MEERQVARQEATFNIPDKSPTRARGWGRSRGPEIGARG